MSVTRPVAALLVAGVLSALCSGATAEPVTDDAITISARVAQQAEDEGFDFSTWCECMNTPATAASTSAS